MDENQDILIAPASPDVKLICLLHRAADGFVSFHRGGKPYQNLFSICAGELSTTLPRVKLHLVKNGLFSINAFRQPYAKCNAEFGLPGPFRREDGLRYLNACFVDLDCYLAGWSQAGTLAEIQRLERIGSIPPRSVTLFSGRGIWLFWLLGSDDDLSQPPKAFPEKLATYRKIQRCLKDKFAQLGADASDAVRTCRIPGGLNTKIQQPVSYRINTGTTGHYPTYTLAELHERLCEAPLQSPRKATRMSERQLNARRRGYAALQEGRLRQFEKLRELRGGFCEGCRNYAALLYAVFLRGCRFNRIDIEYRVEELARECRPRLSRCEVRGAIKSSLKTLRFADRTIAQWLDIKPEESSELETWPPAPRFRQQRLPEPTRIDRTEARRKLIVAITADCGGKILSTRAMKKALSERGHDASPQTIANDYKVLGFSSTRVNTRNCAGRAA